MKDPCINNIVLTTVARWGKCFLVKTLYFTVEINILIYSPYVLGASDNGYRRQHLEAGRQAERQAAATTQQEAMVSALL